jgi:hypothetical protein
VRVSAVGIVEGVLIISVSFSVIVGPLYPFSKSISGLSIE